MLHFWDTRYRRALVDATRQLIIGGVVAFVIFGIAWMLYWTVADTQLGAELDEEDGLFEWIGAAAFLAGAILQFILYLRSDVPPTQRLIGFARRNPFHLGLAIVLFLGFAEEISWGQRVIGWDTPVNMPIENMQGETNLHNLAPFHGDSLFNIHRLFNLFWFSYCVLLPITAVAIPILAAFYRRISLPVPALWVGGLFLGAFLAWRTYHALEPAGALASGQELAETSLALCFMVLGLAQLGIVRIGQASRATPAVVLPDPFIPRHP